ncbi:MAG: cytochrome c [Salinisphaera sp.]|jgi:mono/diheme cytochrome c family protein|nr:cytochrome c [Salinisphaera sp.]
MMTFPMRTLHFSLAMLGLLTIVGGIFSAIFFFGGFYDVAANHPDPHIVDWALVHVRTASVTRHAIDRPPAGALDDPAMVQAGAVIYSRNGCTNCHGEPGVESAKFSEGLNPPPDLRKVVTNLTPEEMFWVIKNGIKMSAMPSFGVDKPPVTKKNIWAIVAYLKNLSNVSDPNFKAWNETPIGGHWVSGCGPGRGAGCGPGRK